MGPGGGVMRVTPEHGRITVHHHQLQPTMPLTLGAVIMCSAVFRIIACVRTSNHLCLYAEWLLITSLISLFAVARRPGLKGSQQQQTYHHTQKSGSGELGISFFYLNKRPSSEEQRLHLQQVQYHFADEQDIPDEVLEGGVSYDAHARQAQWVCLILSFHSWGVN